MQMGKGHTLRGCVDWNTSLRYSDVKNLSHPAWVCGLKLLLLVVLLSQCKVTPCVGVWIETSVTGICLSLALSHPAWVCGLKLSMDAIRSFIYSHTLRGCVDWNINYHLKTWIPNRHTLRGCVDWNSYSQGAKDAPTLSHPAWVCGLKQGCRGSSSWSGVTPCVGVWIETKSFSPVCISPWVTPCVGVWIETAICDLLSYLNIVTPCVGVWIETYE